ncbi:hypothetical protein [Pseudobacteroides cellulosolvens]|uniref:Uncharacterized protein n=1 Tax=Pseudobacteroides cellulosolvens ATCC 35603 = DSM 2933 TaxID=398512 RepID=A0A0L6JPH2_9FIRM|nr:hypothetical protein [Pseudobacteroides cellulosolvens]KNY27689.1 hypothetical protein Bccel_2960 [Pseudobacteroides cellulosolvens ATCC 35603 = DSM 2933]
MPNTEVSIPLTKQAALIGRFEGEAEVNYLTLSGLAALNSRTGMYSERFLYHPYKNFIMVKHDKTLGKEMLMI